MDSLSDSLLASPRGEQGLCGPCGREINPSARETFFPNLCYYIIHHFVFAILPNLITVLAYHFMFYLFQHLRRKDTTRQATLFDFLLLKRQTVRQTCHCSFLCSLSPGTSERYATGYARPARPTRPVLSLSGVRARKIPKQRAERSEATEQGYCFAPRPSPLKTVGHSPHALSPPE